MDNRGWSCSGLQLEPNQAPGLSCRTSEELLEQGARIRQHPTIIRMVACAK